MRVSCRSGGQFGCQSPCGVSRERMVARMSREEAIRILATHPAVVEVLDAPQPGEPDSGMLMLRLEDEQVIGIDPSLADPVRSGEPEATRVARMHRAVDAMRASGGDGQMDLDAVVPLVRSADYFVAQAAPQGQLSPAAVGWLTDFIGFGLAIDEPTTLRVVPESDLPSGRTAEYDIELQGRAIGNLRVMEETMAFSEMGLGPDVLALTAPPGNEAAWFADAAAMEELLGRLGERTGTAWAVIPARRNDVFLVNVATERWGDLLDDLEEAVVARDGLHPLPHVVTNRRWQLSLPPRSSRLGQRLQRLRQHSEMRMYNVLKETVQREYEHYVSDYEDLYALDDELFSMAFVPEGVHGSSIPMVDVIAFERGHSVLDVPYAEVAKQLPHLVAPHPGTHPTRVIVTHPSDDDYARLGSLTL